MKTIKILFASLLFVVLIGCGRKHHIENDSREETGEADMVYMSVTSDNASMCCDIAAEVEVSPYMREEQLNLRLLEWNSDRIEETAKKLFDGGTYEEVYPYEISDYEKLAEQEQFVSSVLDNVQIEKKYSSQLDEIQYYKSSQEGTKYQQIEKNGLLYTIEPKGNLVASGTMSIKFETCRLRGKINDVYCEMQYTNDALAGEYIYITPYVRSSDNVQFYSGIQDDDVNVCDYDKSEQCVLDIMVSLADLNVQIAEVKNRELLSDSTILVDGYRFVCVPEYSDPWEIDDFDYASYVESGKTARQSKMIVDVNQYGIDQIKMPCSFYECEDKPQAVKLKSLDEFNECAADYIRSQLDIYEMYEGYKPDILVNRLVLKNIIVRKNEDYISVPAYVYYEKNDTYSDGVAESEPWFAVDAVDGSIYELGVLHDDW